MLIQLIIIVCCHGQYINDNLRGYVEHFYGNKFSVNEDYPMRVKLRQYAHLHPSVPQPEHNASTIYPDKLWLALIHTIPKNIDHIEMTRNTWCRPEHQQRFGFRCVFVLVESTVIRNEMVDVLREMNRTHHDIYFIPMPDTLEHWFTLQLKNINAYIMALDLFPGYRFYTRVDDQVMVTPDLLSDFLLSIPPTASSVGVFLKHKPYRKFTNKYFDPLAVNIPRYFHFPLGFFSMFSSDIIRFIGTWEHYYHFAPSSLEDPGFGHWLYGFANATNQKVGLYTPEKWGGNMYWEGQEYGDYILFHDLKTKLNVTMIYNRRVSEGHFD